jgi:hypothetical protein
MEPMADHPPHRWRWPSLRHALIEIAFIMFLFYANLLMGEFTHRNEAHRTLFGALRDICTLPDFAIALVTAAIAYVVFEWLRAEM